MLWLRSPSIKINNCTQQSSNTSQQSLQSRAIKRKERGVAVGGCHSSVAECWRLKPEALGSIPGGATFLSFPLPFQRSIDSNGTWLSFIRRSLSVFPLWGSPVHRTPHAVIMVTIHYDCLIMLEEISWSGGFLAGWSMYVGSTVLWY